MRFRYRTVLAIILALIMALSMTACGNDDAEEAAAADAGSAAGTEESEPEENASEAPDAEVVKAIEGVDEDLGPMMPLMIDSIILYDDGSVAVIPTDELRKNEINDDAEAVYPFEDSGEVADVYVMSYGNAGYRTLIALMKDGSVSAVNGRALVEDHIFAVMDNVANRDNFVSVENVSDESATSIVATTEDGTEVVLDYSLNFDEPTEEVN